LLISFLNNNLICLISGQQDSTPYFQKIQFLLMYMFHYDQPFTKTHLANLAVQAAENVFQKAFWTRHQKELIEKDPKRVLFTSNFGTGKTLLLKTKAEEVAKQIHDLKKRKTKSIQEQTNKSENTENGVKSFFVFLAGKDLLLFQSIRNEFEDLKKMKNVEVEVLSLESKYF
jgi:hypothetical protein